MSHSICDIGNSQPRKIQKNRKWENSKISSDFAIRGLTIFLKYFSEFFLTMNYRYRINNVALSLISWWRLIKCQNHRISPTYAAQALLEWEHQRANESSNASILPSKRSSSIIEGPYDLCQECCIQKLQDLLILFESYELTHIKTTG